MTQHHSFNLIHKPWLPCISLTGKATELSLHQALTEAHTLKTLVGDSPLQTAALHRLLLAILHRIFGPEEPDAWQNLWQAKQFEAEAITAYLTEWQERFDLFHPEQPFYQAADKRVKSKSVISLSHDRAAGNNATLFDHHTEIEGEKLTPAQAARALVTVQSFGLAGLAGIKGATFTDGACASGIIFLVEGDNLKQTLLLNMLNYPTDNDVFPHEYDDAPAWEMDDPLDPERDIPFGYLDYLTWQNRRILFEPEQLGGKVFVRSMTMGPALRLNAAILDTMKHYREDEKLGALSTNFSEDKVLWRDSATFLSFGEMGSLQTPKNLAWLRYLVSEKVLQRQDSRYRYRITTLGMSKKQAKVFFFREERLPLPLAYLADESLVNTLADALQYTSTLAFDLVQATRRMGMFLQDSNADTKKWGELNRNTKGDINDWVAYTGVERHYWAALEVPFYEFMVDLAEKERAVVLETWLKRLQDTAWQAFNQATEYLGNDGKSFKAEQRGHSYLGWRVNELFPKESEVQEQD